MRAARRESGVTVVELVVVMAILGILFGIVPSTIRTDTRETEQAAKALAQQIQLSRFEAVRRNRFAGVHISADGLSFTMFEDSDDNRIFSGDAEVIKKLALATNGFARVQFNLGGGAAREILYDPRGALFGANQQELIVESRKDPTYLWRVQISSQGRVIRVFQ